MHRINRFLKVRENIFHIFCCWCQGLCVQTLAQIHPSVGRRRQMVTWTGCVTWPHLQKTLNSAMQGTRKYDPTGCCVRGQVCADLSVFSAMHHWWQRAWNNQRHLETKFINCTIQPMFYLHSQISFQWWWWSDFWNFHMDVGRCEHVPCACLLNPIWPPSQFFFQNQSNTSTVCNSFLRMAMQSYIFSVLTRY